ncbi:MAG: hypothetical protein J5755_05795 [Clostridia bacterium]|nr:hypothetical protein [Clostridia bacterium]
MKKKIFVIIAMLVVVCLVLVGCESYKNAKFDKGDVSAPVLSNGGSVVVQGNYVYFVNGYSGYLKTATANWFGNVLKGAILRLPVGETDMSKAEVIVPKSVMSESSHTGFSIYGDYIYYVSPSGDEDRSGNVLTGNLQFLRTGLDGQNTAIILEIEDGTSTSYKYAPNGLYYVKDSNLYFKAYAKKYNKKKDGCLIAKDVTGTFFPVSETYQGQETLSDAVFYTKAAEKTYDYSNELWVYYGGKSTKVIDKFTFTNDPVTEYKKAFSVSLLTSRTEANGSLTLVYSKSYYVGTSSSGTTAGTFAYNFASAAEFEAFNPSKEVQFSTEALSSPYCLGIDEGLIAVTSSVMTHYTNVGGQMNAEGYKDDYGSISAGTVFADHGGYIYYLASEVLYRYKTDNSGYVEKLGSDTVHGSFIDPELLEVGGKLMLYFFNETHSDYLYAYDLTNYTRGELEASIMGRMTDADAKADKK